MDIAIFKRYFNESYKKNTTSISYGIQGNFINAEVIFWSIREIYFLGSKPIRSYNTHVKMYGAITIFQ